MAYYYVKNGGSATGDAGRYASQQTGSFATLGAANYYNDIQDAIDNSTTGPVAGDFINVSDLHTFSTSATIAYTGLIGATYYVASVDDANIDAGRTSGNFGDETTTGSSGDINITDQFISGMLLYSADNFNFTGNNTIIDSVIKSTGGTDLISLSTDNVNLRFVNSEWRLDNPSGGLTIKNSAFFTMEGGKVTTISAGLNNFLQGAASGGGYTAIIKGADLSAVTGNLVAAGGGAIDDDTIEVRMDMCKTDSGVSFCAVDFTRQHHRALFTRCSDSSAAAEYQYFLRAYGGDVEDDSAIFRNEDEAFTESNQKISYKITTTSGVNLGAPLWFDFPILRYSELSSASTDTLRFYITSNSALTDKDIYLEVSYPDGTNKQTPTFLTSAPATVGGSLDVMAAATTLTTDGASSWTGALSNLYQIDVDTSGDVGSDCQPIVKVYVTIPSVTIQIASEFGLS